MPNFSSHYYLLLFFHTIFGSVGGKSNDLSHSELLPCFPPPSLSLSLSLSLIDMKRDRPIWSSCGRFREGTGRPIGRNRLLLPPSLARSVIISVGLRASNVNVTRSHRRPRESGSRSAPRRTSCLVGRKCLPIPIYLLLRRNRFLGEEFSLLAARTCKIE